MKFSAVVIIDVALFGVVKVQAQGKFPIGGCSVNADCVATNSHCELTKLCECNDNYVSQLDAMDCLGVVDAIDGPCSESPQCQQGKLGKYSDCVANKCVCIVGSVHLNDKCRPFSSVGDPCEDDEDCIPGLGPESECQSMACACKSGFVGSGDKKRCLPKVQVGENCEEMAQCPANGVCRFVTGKCKCNLEFVESGDKWSCLALQHNIGGACEVSQQCQEAKPGPYSDCLEDAGRKVCKCKPDAFDLDDVCYPKATNVGDPCGDSVHCENVSFTECVQNRCECKSGFVGNPGGLGCFPIKLRGKYLK